MRHRLSDRQEPHSRHRWPIQPEQALDIQRAEGVFYSARLVLPKVTAVRAVVVGKGCRA